MNYYLMSIRQYSDIKKQQWRLVQKWWRFISLVSLIRFGTIQKLNSRQMVHNLYIFINIIAWHTIKFQNLKFSFVFSFSYLSLLLLYFFCSTSFWEYQWIWNNILFSGSKTAVKAFVSLVFISRLLARLVHKRSWLIAITSYLSYFLFIGRNLFVFLKYFQEPNYQKENFFKTLNENIFKTWFFTT